MTPKTKSKNGLLLLGVVLLGSLFLIWQPARATDDSVYPIDGSTTISLGNQGLFINDDLYNVEFVEIIKIRPPLPTEYTSGVNITIRGPALDIKFMDADLATVKPGLTLSSVYFNIDESLLRVWEEGGPAEIAIWYYDKILKNWQICPTRFVSSNQNNGKLDRLACFVMGNGVYFLGNLEIELSDLIYPIDRTKTITLGKQGVFISNPPSNVEYVKIERIKPPLPPKLTFGVDLAYRGSALEINFLNSRKTIVKPWATLSSVYFNISEPEVKMWEEGGSDAIGILYYNPSTKKWQSCPTRYLQESLSNGKYDRLACLIIGNGFYTLGKLEFDPVFPLWFKLQGKELERRKIPYD